MTPSPRPRPQFEGKLKACRAGGSGGVGSHHSTELLRLAPGKTWHTQPLWVADIQYWHVVLGLGKPKAKPLTVPGFPTGAGVGGKRRGGQGRKAWGKWPGKQWWMSAWRPRLCEPCCPATSALRVRGRLGVVPFLPFFLGPSTGVWRLLEGWG